MSRFAGKNKAVNHELITGDSTYLQLCALYDTVCQAIASDPRIYSDPRARGLVNRASNLVRSESTQLFRPQLDALNAVVQADPTFSNTDFEVMKSLIVSPVNKQNSQFDLIGGWHGADVHHGVPASAVAKQLSMLPYKEWGQVLGRAGGQIPITSQAYNGVAPTSRPGHNLAHFDPIGRQFFKGEGAAGIERISPGTSLDDAIEVLVDSAKSQKLISDMGHAADDQNFKPVLAAYLSEKLKRDVSPSEFTDTTVSPFGRGITVSGYAKQNTDDKMVRTAEKEAYGTDHGVQGATQYLEDMSGRTDLIKTNDEKKAEKSAADKLRRLMQKNGTYEATPRSVGLDLVRADGGEELRRLGLDVDTILGATFN